MRCHISAMNYEHMSEESLSSVADSDVATAPDPKPDYQSTGSTPPVTASPEPESEVPQTTITITREGAQTPAVLAVRTSAHLTKSGYYLIAATAANDKLMRVWIMLFYGMRDCFTEIEVYHWVW